MWAAVITSPQQASALPHFAFLCSWGLSGEDITSLCHYLTFTGQCLASQFIITFLSHTTYEIVPHSPAVAITSLQQAINSHYALAHFYITNEQIIMKLQQAIAFHLASLHFLTTQAVTGTSSYHFTSASILFPYYIPENSLVWERNKSPAAVVALHKTGHHLILLGILTYMWDVRGDFGTGKCHHILS